MVQLCVDFPCQRLHLGDPVDLISEKFDADTDVSDFGFDTPQNTITMTTDDNTYTIVVGAKNAMLSQYYIKVNDDVYLSSTTIPSQFAVTLDNLIQSDDSEDTETTAE